MFFLGIPILITDTLVTSLYFTT